MNDKFDFEAFTDEGAICSVNSRSVILGWGRRINASFPLEFPCWYSTDFFLKEIAPYYCYEHHLQIHPAELARLLPSGKQDQPKWEPIDWNPFRESFSIFESGVKKIVPYVQKKAPYQIQFSAHLSAALAYLERQPKTTLYGRWGQGRGVLGVTPEVLLQLEPGKPLKTVACAGTLTPENEGLWGQDLKLLKEHQLVIDGIEQDLSPFGKVSIGKTVPCRFSRLIHLVTPIELHPLKPLSFELLVQKLHPTPALGGYPKAESQAWLSSYAKMLPRGQFGAPFGLLTGEGRGAAYVAIRNMEWTDDQIILRAGCGIVKESSLEEETKEIENKLSAIQEILGL